MDWVLAAHIAEGAARAAGGIARRAFSLPRQVSYKKGYEPVTETDREIEKFVSEIIQKAFPETRIIGEEGANVGTGSTPIWWIDPIDGTFFFARGVPQFTISIGCADADGKMMVGVVYDPMFDECFCAVRGQGATCNGEPIHVSEVKELRDALVSNNSNQVPEWSALMPVCRTVARTGSAALSLCYVANGRFDAYWQHNLSPWDVAAGTLIAEEAGGVMTTYEGTPLAVSDPKRLLVSNGHLHQIMSGYLKNT
jgi:myo-inositol-1(or 4)-monophosphatase